MAFLVASKSFILRLKIHCSGCERKVKRLLLRAPGVRSVDIDPKEGTVAISATVEPSEIMMLLDKALSLKAELLWEQQTPSSSSSSIRDIGQKNNDLQIVPKPSRRMVDDDLRFSHDTDPDVVSQLQQISKIKGLKSVEVCYSKNEVSRSKAIKLTFKGQNDDFADKDHVELIIKDEVQNPRSRPGGGGGICDASSSCCGGHHHHHRGVCGCGGNGPAPGYPISSNNNGNLYWPPPLPTGGGYSPSAPPIGTATYYYDYDARPPPPPPPPATDYSFFNRFSDENTSGSCIVIPIQIATINNDEFNVRMDALLDKLQAGSWLTLESVAQLRKKFDAIDAKYHPAMKTLPKPQDPDSEQEPFEVKTAVACVRESEEILSPEIASEFKETGAVINERGKFPDEFSHFVANEITLVDLDTNSMISHEIHDTHVEMLSLVDATSINLSPSYAYDVVSYVVGNNCVANAIYDDLMHIGELNSVMNELVLNLFENLCLGKSWVKGVTCFRGGTEVCLNLTVDSMGVNYSTGLRLNVLDENSVDVGKSSPMPVNKMRRKAWVENVTGFRGGTMLLETEKWMQISTYFSGDILRFEGHMKQFMPLERSSFIWIIAWREMVTVETQIE
ncbi:OLC1v1027642C1 [Oldenlandia corymbosa var. corymbosa]|uniref:OLC1v1027642C1 n=1 Tax=Oldenlandia corymbosa var. corymbosa TaxID=529605 RepID=A0AAV1CCZ1_OLDCO|nr:OLC1v1027642C1 [Oldenlandia corymbosa var. corymbosa]